MDHLRTNMDLLNVLPIYNGDLNEQELEEKKDLLEFFKAKYMRGIWHMFMTMVYNISMYHSLDYEPIKCICIIHFCFMYYCKDIYCMICRGHAAEFISKNQIIDAVYNCENDDEMIFIYFEWFYRFRNAANSHLGKIGPPFREAINFFSGEHSQIDKTDFEYPKIQNGIWHVLFMIATKCHQLEHVRIIYFFIKTYMNFLPLEQKNFYEQFKFENNFELALHSSDSVESICVAFFDWIYELYRFINLKSDIRVFSKKVLKEAYYNISFCDHECDK